MFWHAYQIFPIDSRWDHLPTFYSVKRECQHRDMEALINPSNADPGRLTTESLRKAYQQAQQEALKVGWEGDFRHEAAVFWLPVEEAFLCGFVWKQENNGATFVLSPIALPHLERDCVLSSSGQYL